MKFTKYMALLLLSISMCIGFAACGSDDDDNGVVSGKSELVGRWLIDVDYGFKFDADGNGYGWENEQGEIERWPITWTFRNDVITIYEKEGALDEEIEVLYMDEGSMLCRYNDESDTWTMTKVRKFSWE